MERRRFVSQPQMSDLGPDHMRNDQHPGHPMNFDGSSMLPSHTIASQNRSVVPHANTAMRMGDISCGSYVCPPSSSRLSRLPPYYMQNGPCYNQVIVTDATDMSHSQLDYGRASHKRKIPSMSDAERGALSGYYDAGSSSSFPSQAGYLAGHGYWAVDPASSERSYRGNELFSSEDTSQRNVRSRHGNVLDLETISTGVHSSRYRPQHFPSPMNSANPTVSEQWNHNSGALDQRAIGNSSDLGSFNREMHHLNRGRRYGPNVSMGNNGHNHPNAVFSRTVGYPLPHPLETTAQPSVLVHSSSNQRSAHRTPVSYPAAGFTTNTQDFRVSTGVTAIPPRYSRNLSILGYDNGGSRARNQFQIFSNADNAPARWAHEGAVMFGPSSFYSSMNYFDQHSDMRLDIDNLSYEELLALEERIGSVNTGLTEEALSKCLLESIYCSSEVMHDDQDNENCVICLESYEDRERLGKLSCRHEFHSHCIRRWLSIKNACPICKVSALEDKPNDEHAISM